ncbi:hypothetical protein ONZ45_g15966 [Pleurotus djamor]|nr:hypothetical protein ONZ45_g15966 [Pleurotus djamor]
MSFLFHVLRTSFLPFLMILAHFAAAAPRNVTIDDEYGDERTLEVPRYAPDGGWAQGSGCPGCLQLDDKNRAIRGTWHDSTHHPNDPTRSITFNFNGSAIYVYCIIANKYKEGVDTLASYTFTIDGDLVGRFDHAPEDTPTFYYNSLVYHNSSIPPGPHTFSFIADSQENTTLILFDYAQYTVEIEDPPSNVAANSPTNTTKTLDTNTTDTTTPMGRQPSTQQIAEIVAGVLGGVSVVGLGFILYLLRHRIRRKKQIDQNPEAALRARPTRPTVSTSPANRPEPPRQPSNPGPDAITPFLAFTPSVCIDQSFYRPSAIHTHKQ